MIYLPHNEVSVFFKDRVMPSWNRNGYHVDLFEGTVPADLKDLDILDFVYLPDRKIEVKRRDFTETEKAVWYSHYRLWEKCVELNEPIIVIEHDSQLKKHLPQFTTSRYLSWVTETHNMRRKPSDRDPGDGNMNFLSPASGYYINPGRANIMIKNAQTIKIYENVDGFMRKHINWKDFPHDFYYIEQIKYNNLNTIDHGPQRKYLKTLL